MSNRIEKWMNDPKSLSQQDFELLSESIKDYPYAQSLRLMYLANLKERNYSIFLEELKKSALYISDRKLLYYLLEEAKENKREESVPSISNLSVESEHSESNVAVEEAVEQDKTFDLIDSFLSTLPTDDLESDGLELATDYTGYILEGEEINSAPPLEGQDLIDEFINAHASSHTPVKETPPLPIKTSDSIESKSEEVKEDLESESEDEGFFTETLAKIYVKQQRYAKALEILKKLSLKYPNKNAYFADQIRFLEKLIINDKSK